MKNTSGWNEWAQHRASLYIGCSSNCRYCFARCEATRFKRVLNAEAWRHPVLNEKAAAVRWTKRAGVVAFPGAHDITLETVVQCRAYLERILQAGNQVLIVTKPRAACVHHLATHLRPWREQIEWRLTITARDGELLRYWEPGASSYAERLEALYDVFNAGYRASVSVEPCLDPDDLPGMVGDLVRAGPLASIWIGKMNQIRRRVKIETPEDRRQVERIEAGQTDARILELVEALRGNGLILWKDSIQQVIDRHQG